MFARGGGGVTGASYSTSLGARILEAKLSSIKGGVEKAKCGRYQTALRCPVDMVFGESFAAFLIISF